MSRPPSILHESATGSVVVIDLPRSLEEAQLEEGGDEDPNGRGQQRRRLVSAPAPTEPFPLPPDPPLERQATSCAGLAAQLAELTTGAAVESALDELRQSGFHGPWCLERVEGKMADKAEKREPGMTSPPRPSHPIYIPPSARCLAGSIAACRQAFLAEAPPSFDLIVLDPPWPNRSARRRRQGRRRSASGSGSGSGSGSAAGSTRDTGYVTSPSMDAIRDLLESIPVGAKLTDGLVAVWVTNKPACVALLTDPHTGLFRSWGVELVASWTWLKVTAQGEPVVPVDAQWRRPWERLLLARRCGRPASRCSFSLSALPANRVVISVPDVHSRKPHLRPLLSPFFLPSPDGRRRMVGLEVFARNLTAGWWAWGDEVLLFQQEEWWREEI